MTDWIALPNKSGMFAIRKDQVTAFHDIMPGETDGYDARTPRVRIHLKDSMPRVVPMSALDFAQLLGFVPPTEELTRDLKPCVLVSTTIAETVISDPETTMGVVPLERSPKPSRRTMGYLYNALGTIPGMSPELKASIREHVRGLIQGPDKKLDFFEFREILRSYGLQPTEVDSIVGVTLTWYNGE